MDLTGKVAIVTGASTEGGRGGWLGDGGDIGIGKGGALVAVRARRKEPSEKPATLTGGPAIAGDLKGELIVA